MAGGPSTMFSIFFISGLIQELWSRSPSIQFPAQLAVRSFKVQTIEIALHHCTILWWFNGKKAMCLKFELPKWHFLTYACNSKTFGAKSLLLKCFKRAAKWLYAKIVSGSVQMLKQWINWMFSKMHHSIWKILSVLGTNEYLERLEGKIRKCLFFYVKIF